MEDIEEPKESQEDKNESMDTHEDITVEEIDIDIKKKGAKLLPDTPEFTCKCGNKIDLIKINTQIKRSIGK